MLRLNSFRSRKTVLTLSLASISLVGATVIAMASIADNESADAEADAGVVEQQPAAPSPVQIAMTLGVTPESAAIANLNAAGLDVVFDYCSANLENASECVELDSYIEVSEQYLAELSNDVRRSGLTDERRELMAETESTIRTLTDARDAVLNAMRTDLRATLAGTVGEHGAGLLRNYSMNLDRRVPREYKCLDLTEQQWADLAAALDKSEINIAATHDETVDRVELTDDESDVLALVDSSSDVTLAEQRLNTVLPAVRIAFDRATEDR